MVQGNATNAFARQSTIESSFDYTTPKKVNAEIISGLDREILRKSVQRSNSRAFLLQGAGGGLENASSTADHNLNAPLAKDVGNVAPQAVGNTSSSKDNGPYAADQRISQDIKDFSNAFADFFGRTFKPMLDVILSTKQLTETLGGEGPVMLYSYFLISGFFVGLQTPPFSRFVAKKNALESEFTTAHSRIVQHAEEIAFLQGESQEKNTLNKKLEQLLDFRKKVAVAHWRQNILDQWCVKYCASVVGMCAISYPLMMQFATGRGPQFSKSRLISKHRTADAVIRNAAQALGDIILMYKKVFNLIGFGIRLEKLLPQKTADGRYLADKELDEEDALILWFT